MANEKSNSGGCDGTIPHLFVKRRDEALNFYKRAFGAEEMLNVPAPDSRRHAEFQSFATRTRIVPPDQPA